MQILVRATLKCQPLGASPVVQDKTGAPSAGGGGGEQESKIDLSDLGGGQSTTGGQTPRSTSPEFFICMSFSTSSFSFPRIYSRNSRSTVSRLSWESASVVCWEFLRCYSFPCCYGFTLSPTGIFLVTENIMCLLHKAVLLKSEVFPFLFLGEAKNRKYDSSSFHRFNLYGIPTPHFNDGRNMAKTLHWLHELQM